MGMELTIIDPLTYPGWDQLMLKTDSCSFFHTSHWARVLNESYNYTPVYFTAINDTGGISALIPCMEVNSRITGKRGVSIPFY